MHYIHTYAADNGTMHKHMINLVPRYLDFLFIVLMEVRVEIDGTRNRQRCGQTVHPTEKFTSMNLFKICWVVTWA